MTLAASSIRLLMELRRHNLPDCLLRAIECTPREVFVPALFADKAYEDCPLPLPHGQTISQPSVVAKMLAALDVASHHQVLEVGTGSGYQTAILARLARRVFSLDIHRQFIIAVQPLFVSLGLFNITAMTGDGHTGWPAAAPFDRIILAAACTTPPFTLLKQLKDGGKMILPLEREGGTQELVSITRNGNQFSQHSLGTARFVPMQGNVMTAAAGVV